MKPFIHKIPRLPVFALALTLTACSENSEIPLNEEVLADYIEINSHLELDDLIACAGGRMNGLNGQSDSPTSVFFYPISGATDFRYFEAVDVADSTNFNQYFRKEIPSEPIFNGYLWKFNNSEFSDERMGIVTFLTEGKLHFCTPIRQKTNPKPTEVNPGLLTIQENNTSPSFQWSDGLIDENVIYFQVISDLDGNFISGTYTLEKNFTFYNLENVVLNISQTDPVPALEVDQEYLFTLMAVSEDNWVNLFVEKEFSTN